MIKHTTRLLQALGPAVGTASPLEAVRAGLGALLGLALAGIFVLAPTVDLRTGLYLIAPFGASSVLLFAVPNSPLAQPWSVIVGNTIGAFVAIAVCLTTNDPVLRVALAVGLAIAATILCRALHPPAGAVAMTIALNPEAIADLGFRFALTPVAVGSILLVVIAAVWARLTGRHYPFRHFDDRNTHGTGDRAPIERLGLSEEELTAILDQYRQSFNLGVEDLARLIGAAEMQAATHLATPVTAADIMSKNLVTVAPETRLSDIADLFRRHRFTSLPVVADNDRYLGIIFQIHLIARGREDALRLDRGFSAAMTRLIDRRRERPVRAEEIMGIAGPRASPTTPLAALLPLLADGEVDAVPVLAHGRILGIVTRTDLVAVLARASLRS